MTHHTPQVDSKQHVSNLKIGQRQDQFENEANTVADQIIAMPQPPTPIHRKYRKYSDEQLQMKPLSDDPVPTIRRQEDEKEEQLQMKTQEGSTEQLEKSGLSNLSAKIKSTKGTGPNLSEATNHRMSHIIGTDFSKVNIHTDEAAIQMNRSLGAKAFTHGSDIYFNKGAYNPTSTKGQRLLAHELTHVAQQSTSLAHTGSTLPSLQKSEEDLREAFDNELDDVVVNVKKIWPAIRNETDQAARDRIKNDAEIEGKIRRRASKMKLLKTYLLLTYQSESNFPTHFKEILDATDRLGTHEARINAILGSVSQTEREELQEMPGLVEVLESELSGADEDTATNLLNTNVEPSNSGSNSHGLPSFNISKRGERHALNWAAKTKFSDKKFDDVVELIREASNREGGSNGINILNDHSLWAIIAKKYKPKKVWYLRMVAHHKGRVNFKTISNQPHPYITNIWQSVKGHATKKDELIAELAIINNSILDRNVIVNDPWFAHMLVKELSGDDLDAALAAISINQPTPSDKQKQLLKAIRKRDIQVIRDTLTDTELSEDHLVSLSTDPKILAKMGAKLKGVDLAETALLLHYGHNTMPANVVTLIEKFRGSDIDVSDIETFLQGLSKSEQDDIINEPGIYIMIINSGLPYDDRNKLLAALRSHDPDWQLPGSEGTHRAKGIWTAQQRLTTLPVHFTSDAIRIPLRFNIDVSDLPPDYKFKKRKIEKWIRAIDKYWNGKFEMVNGDVSLPLVFVTYMTEDMPNPNKTLKLLDGRGDAFVRPKSGVMNLYIKGQDGRGVKDKTVAHEFGHIIGNPDEYSLNNDDYKLLTGETVEGGRGGTDVKGMMGSQWKSTELKDRHIKVVEMIVNKVKDPTVYPNPFIANKL